MLTFICANWVWILIAIAVITVIGIVASFLGGVKRLILFICVPFYLTFTIIIGLIRLIFCRRDK